MASVNKVILIGNLGRDPEVRYAPSGAAVCNVSIATTRQWKDKSGEKKEETDWHRVVFYDRLAEIAGRGRSACTLAGCLAMSCHRNPARPAEACRPTIEATIRGCAMPRPGTDDRAERWRYRADGDDGTGG